MSRPAGSPTTEAVRHKIDAIDTEMKRLGMWSAEPPPAEAFVDMGPFGMRTMTFEQWLQFVLVPRVRELLASGGPWPKGSAVGVHAVRNLSDHPGAQSLITLLVEFDSLFEADEGEGGRT